MMLVSVKSFVCIKCKFPNYSLAKISQTSTITLARKKDYPQNVEPNNNKNMFEFKISNKILAQSVIAVLGLGLLDAGYSGDWSRIGVISKESEDALKVAAYVVVPICLFLIFSLSKDSQN